MTEPKLLGIISVFLLYEMVSDHREKNSLKSGKSGPKQGDRNSLNCVCFDQNLAIYCSICEGFGGKCVFSHHGRLSFARFQLLCLPALQARNRYGFKNEFCSLLQKLDVNPEDSRMSNGTCGRHGACRSNLHTWAGWQTQSVDQMLNNF